MPMKRELYPDNWEEISLSIRTEAGWKCEFCDAENGKPHPITGSKEEIITNTRHSIYHSTTRGVNMLHDVICKGEY